MGHRQLVVAAWEEAAVDHLRFEVALVEVEGAVMMHLEVVTEAQEAVDHSLLAKEVQALSSKAVKVEARAVHQKIAVAAEEARLPVLRRENHHDYLVAGVVEVHLLLHCSWLVEEAVPKVSASLRRAVVPQISSAGPKVKEQASFPTASSEALGAVAALRRSQLYCERVSVGHCFVRAYQHQQAAAGH